MYNRPHLTQFLHRCRIRILAAALPAVLFCGCSGTGTMFTPEEAQSDSTYGAADSFSGEPSQKEERLESDDFSAEHDEEHRKRRIRIEGTGSDLYTVQTIDSYYRFTLDGSSLQLPCSTQDLNRAGWSLRLSGPEKGDDGNGTDRADGGNDAEEVLVPPCSYEFFTFLSAEGAEAETAARTAGENLRQIRVCLANDTREPLSPADCIVCGITVDEENGVSLKTAFEAGIGSPLSDLTAVFGTDSSVFTRTAYNDGTVTVQYRFSNGLSEEERIPVLAEAEEKGIAEQINARTAEDGSTITSLSLYYFRIPD